MIRTGAAVFTFAVCALSPTSAHAEDRVLLLDDGRVDTSTDPRACATDTDVVGRRRCPVYGLWGAALEAPYMFVAVGFNMRHLPRAQVGRTPGAAARAVTTGVSDTPEAAATGGSDSSLSYTERFGVAVSRALYFGLEAEIGPTTTNESPPGGRTFGAGGLAFAGLQGGTRLLKLGGEIAGGGRLVETALADERLTGEGVLEARARADLWLTPWVTIGGLVGTSLIAEGDWVAGISIGLHTYSYGGQP